MKGTFSIFFFICVYSIVNAQNPVAGIQLSSRYTNPDQAYLDTLNQQMLALEEREITINIDMSSGSGVSQLIVMLGSNEGSSDIFYKKFDFGVTGTFDDGTSYQGSGNSVTVTVGKYSGTHFFAEVIPQMQDETMGSAARNVLQ